MNYCESCQKMNELITLHHVMITLVKNVMKNVQNV